MASSSIQKVGELRLIKAWLMASYREFLAGFKDLGAHSCIWNVFILRDGSYLEQKLAQG
jgi:hypothetical protein